jgi:phage/plasmid primase-like uncharacterized protein
MERAPRHVPCPVHGGKDGFRLFQDWRETGGGISNKDGAFADGISLLMWVNKWSFPETIRNIADVLGGNAGQAHNHSPSRSPAYTPSATELAARERKNEALRETLNRVWCESIHHAHEDALPMRHYLMRRGLFYFGLPETLRYHPALPYRDKDGVLRGHYPAMVAVVQNDEGKPITLHRTFLDDSEGRKALVDEPKKLMPYPTDRTLRGAAIRLGDVRPVLHVTEGIETALAVRQVIQQPVWSCVSATLLEKFHPPAEVDRVIVWADHDVSCRGIEAAENLREYLGKIGVDVEIKLPSMPIPSKAKGVDWLDVLNFQGHEAIRKAFRSNIRSVA